MYRLQLMLLLTVFACGPAVAQDPEPESGPETTTAASDDEAQPAAETDDEVTDEEIDDLLGLDEDYSELEDDFDPTEEVRFEQSIPFPTDI